MPYRSVPPSVRRRSIARRLYAEQPRERPDWIDEQLLRPGQVALLFQVSRRTIGDWARAGKLDAIITPGGHRRFRATQVRALLAAQRVAPTAPDYTPKAGGDHDADRDGRARTDGREHGRTPPARGP